MSYGALIKNRHGKSVIDDNEETYMFYKKVEATIGSSGGVTIDLHTPSNWHPMVFLHVSDLHFQKFEMLGAAITTYSGQSLKGVVYNYNNSQPRKYTWYVFLACNHFKAPPWGLVVNKPNGIPSFHTGRPILHIKKLAGRSDGVYGHSFKPAAGCNPLRATYIGTPGSSTRYGFLTGLGTSFYNGVRNCTLVGGGIIGGGYNISSHDLSTHYPIIDAAYYDKFSNARPNEMSAQALKGFRFFTELPQSFAALPPKLHPNFKEDVREIGESLDPCYDEMVGLSDSDIKILIQDEVNR